MPGRFGGSESNYRHDYQGQYAEHDFETGYHAFDSRMYDSRILRFNSPDPAGQFWSSYMAMGNNWPNGVDPDGEWFFGLFGSTSAERQAARAGRQAVRAEARMKQAYLAELEWRQNIVDLLQQQGYIAWPTGKGITAMSPTGEVKYIDAFNRSGFNSLAHEIAGTALIAEGPSIFKWLSKGNAAEYKSLGAAAKGFSKLGSNARKMKLDEIGEFLGEGANWHKTSAKSDFLKLFKSKLQGSTNADFYIDKVTNEVLLKGNKTGSWVGTGMTFP